MNKINLCLILDNIRSRENVGSIFRTCDGAGVSKIYLCGITPTPEKSKFEILNPKQILNPRLQIQNTDKIAKTALGAEKWVPWEHQSQTWRCLLKLKMQNKKLKIIALEQAKNSKNIFDYKLLNKKNRPTNISSGESRPEGAEIALVAGNEVKGISSKILSYCDEVVHIPMYGKKESLNVSVAIGIALYTLSNK